MFKLNQLYFSGMVSFVTLVHLIIGIIIIIIFFIYSPLEKQKHTVLET